MKQVIKNVLECTVNYQENGLGLHCNLSICVGIMEVGVAVSRSCQELKSQVRTGSLRWQDLFHQRGWCSHLHDLIYCERKSWWSSRFQMNKVHNVLTEVGLPSEVLGKDKKWSDCAEVCIARTLLLYHYFWCQSQTQVQILQLLYKTAC